MAKQPTDIFRNRIIGYGTKPADQFQANPLNFRKHPQRQRDAVNASLRSLGWIATVIENTTTGNLLDGHERVWQALPRNEDVPYLQVELTEDEERLALSIFDPIGAMAETDANILDELLRSVNTDEEALQNLLNSLAIKSGLYAGEPIDPNEEWVGMPEFVQENTFGAIASVVVYLANKDDLKRFADLMGQTVTVETKSIWYPRKERTDLDAYRMVENES